MARSLPRSFRALVLVAAALASWTCGSTFVSGWAALRSRGRTTGAFGRVALCAAKKKASGGDPVCDGDTVYIKVMTGRYVGEIDGTTKKEWVKARGTKKDKEHALKIEKKGGGEVESGDIVMFVMPNGAHMDVMGSAVRARYYDPRGEWQKIMIIKQEGGAICAGDKIFLKGMFSGGRDYLDANPMEKAPDGEVKCRWPDEGDWQVMTIEKEGRAMVLRMRQIRVVMPNGAHMDVMGSAVRARYYDPRGEWQKIMVIKQEGGVICAGDKIFLKGMFSGGRDYLDANPLEKAPDGEVKCRWPDEGDWQVMTIEK
eukprot:CAMPEP_0117567080 /NCGR_PEP_ID=MMETSP0784-20121206/57418_1 /TAXON_ID=39447 /ORGANISM="" /LENGTH=312 /DNA_ID=CAMNT_0005364931 /DNA_START=95 /DNA_END=1034 /DNA_ORIENTATION=-